MHCIIEKLESSFPCLCLLLNSWRKYAHLSSFFRDGILYIVNFFFYGLNTNIETFKLCEEVVSEISACCLPSKRGSIMEALLHTI